MRVACSAEDGQQCRHDDKKGHRYHSERWGKDYPRIQITAADVLSGKHVDVPPEQPSPFAQAPRERKREGEQKGLGL